MDSSIIIVGEGLAAYFVGYFLVENGIKDILFISSPQLPPSSQASLGFLAKRGAKNSPENPFGQQVHLGFEIFHEFAQRNGGNWMDSIPLIDVCPRLAPKTDFEDFQRRYGEEYFFSNKVSRLEFAKEYAIHEEEAFHISTPELLQFLKEKTLRSCGFIADTLILPSLHRPFPGEIYSAQGKSYRCEKLILCPGHFGKSSAGPLKEDISKGQCLAGQYLFWENIHWEQSLALYQKESFFLYNKNKKTLYIGIHNNMMLRYTPHWGELRAIYHLFSGLLKRSFPLPSLDKAIIKGDVRLKFPKRLPFFQGSGEDGHPYALLGLYKNSLSVGIYQAKKLAENICSHLK